MKKFNPLKDREDLGTQLLFPVLSWSSMNAFESYDKEKWYDQYVLGNRATPNSAMLAGIEIGEMLALDPTYLPEVPRPQIYEYNIREKFGKMPVIQLTGHLDGWTAHKKEILEYKTSQSKTKWNQKSVDEWGQLSFYALLIYLKHGINPIDLKIKLVSIPVVEQGNFEVKRSKEPIQIFETNRTMTDIMNFGVRIRKIFADMGDYVEYMQNHE